MYLSLHVQARKTKEFLQHIADYLLSKKPFVNGEVVDIPISDNSAYLPKLEERYAGSEGKEAELVEIKDHASRKQIRQNMITHFLKTEFRGALEYKVGMQDPHNSSVYLISFKIKDKAKLQDVIDKINKRAVAEIYPPARFEESPPQLVWGSKVFDLTVGDMPFYICKAAFRKAIGESISWDEVLDEVEGDLKGMDDIKSSKIRDSVKHFNERVKTQTGKDLFKWVTLSFYRLS